MAVQCWRWMMVFEGGGATDGRLWTADGRWQTVARQMTDGGRQTADGGTGGDRYRRLSPFVLRKRHCLTTVVITAVSSHVFLCHCHVAMRLPIPTTLGTTTTVTRTRTGTTRKTTMTTTSPITDQSIVGFPRGNRWQGATMMGGGKEGGGGGNRGGGG